MKYLLDTHTLLWAIIEPTKLSKTAVRIIESPEHQIMVSAISFWEISLKFGMGKLNMEGVVPEMLLGICTEMRLEILALDANICATYHQLGTTYHKDPFDKMLIWQAKCLNIPLVSKDERIKLYESAGVKVVW